MAAGRSPHRSQLIFAVLYLETVLDVRLTRKLTCNAV